MSCTKIMVPKGAEGEIVEITSGSFNITETIAKIKDKDGVVHDVCMLQKWPVRVQRPYTQKLSPDFPMITGSACHRHPVPNRQRRYCCGTGSVRLR